MNIGAPFPGFKLTSEYYQEMEQAITRMTNGGIKFKERR